MAVWNTDTQKLDLVRDVWDIGPTLVDTIFGKYASPYLAPKENLHSLHAKSPWDDVALECGWKTTSDYADALDDLMPYLEGVTMYLAGTPAVYKIINMARLGRFRVRDQFDYAQVNAVATHYSHAVVASTQITPEKFIEHALRFDTDARAKSVVYEGLAESFKYLRVVMGKSGMYEVPQARYFGEGRRDVTIVTAGRLVFMRGTREYTNTCLVFSKKHLDQVVGSAQRLANIFEYLGRAYTGQVLDNFLSYVDFTIEVAGKASAPNTYKVCRAFHKARGIMQQEILGSVLPESILSEIADYRSDGLDGILRLSKYQELLRAFREVHRLEAMHIYKWMPTPDFDATSAFGIVNSYHMSPRPSGADPVASDDMRATWDVVKTERKLHIAHAYHRMTNQWPAGLPHRQSGPSWDEVRTWEPAELLPYYTLGKDISSQVKDKQTVNASLNEEKAGNSRAEESSYLLWYMANKADIDTNRSLAAYPNHGEDNYARVAYKPEAHKPDSRLFYMAPPVIRTLLGELEGNLSTVAKFYPGCLMGKSASEKSKILLDLMDPYSKLAGVDETLDHEVFIIQFDLSKFSPKSNYAVTKDYHDFWSKIYNEPGVAKLATVGTESTILHTTCGLRMEYKNKGADLEGFRGRLMTMFHADLLGAACRIARNRGITTGRAKLAVFIDDGAVKIAVRGNGGEAVDNIRSFLNIMKDVYASAGQDANPSKTCVSRVGGEMLAEFYWRSTKMPVGIKAAMRMYPDYESAVSTIPDEFAALFSTAQGSVKDGADWLSVYSMYITACVKTINRWARREFSLQVPHRLALKLMTPKSYGGFGVQPLQGLVTTAVTNMTAEGLAMLNRAARFRPGLRQEIIKIVTMPIVKREPLSILRDPLRVRADCSVLMENRLVMACVDWLETQGGAIGRYMAEYTGVSLRDHAKAVAEALLDSDTLSLPVLERAWKSTPLAQVEQLISKFKRSATIIRFLGRDGIKKIRGGNMADLKRVLSA